MQLDSNSYNRRKILELPYKESIPGRLWTPQVKPSLEYFYTLRWTTVLLPAALQQIESKEEYFLLLTRRVEWLIEQALDDWRMSHEEQEELQAYSWVIQEINQYLPMYLSSLTSQQSPRQMASYLVMNYQELQQQCQITQQIFPVTPYPDLETGMNYLTDMNLMDWLALMNIEVNPYFQD